MPNLLGPITNWELEISAFDGIGSANFSGDDPTILKGQAATLTTPDRTWEEATSDAGGISPDVLFTHIASMECIFDSESYAVDSGGATLPMLWGHPFTLITYQHIRDGSIGLPRGTGQRVKIYRGACRTLTEGELSQRAIARLSVGMRLFHLQEVIKSGSPQFGAVLETGGVETIRRTGADINVFELDLRTDKLLQNDIDQLSEMAVALGYAA